jgi:hypothetical protein
LSQKCTQYGASSTGATWISAKQKSRSPTCAIDLGQGGRRVGVRGGGGRGCRLAMTVMSMTTTEQGRRNEIDFVNIFLGSQMHEKGMRGIVHSAYSVQKLTKVQSLLFIREW